MSIMFKKQSLACPYRLVNVSVMYHPEIKSGNGTSPIEVYIWKKTSKYQFPTCKSLESDGFKICISIISISLVFPQLRIPVVSFFRHRQVRSGDREPPRHSRHQYQSAASLSRPRPSGCESMLPWEGDINMVNGYVWASSIYLRHLTPIKHGFWTTPVFEFMAHWEIIERNG